MHRHSTISTTILMYRRGLICITLVVIVLCTYYMWFEMRYASKIYETPLNYEKFTVLGFVWLLVPVANLIAGLRTKDEKYVRMAACLSFHYLILFVIAIRTAHNREEWSYEGGHLFTGPIIFIVLSPIVIYAESVLRRLEQKFKTR